MQVINLFFRKIGSFLWTEGAKKIEKNAIFISNSQSKAG